MKRSVLDSFALLAYLLGEARGRAVHTLLQQAQKGQRQVYCCWVNLAEVHYTIARRLGEAKACEVLRMIEELPLHLLAADREISLKAAEVKSQHNIALGDAFTAGTALHLGGEVVTGDPEFRRLESLVPVFWLEGKTKKPV
jgi:ribonuclease VapC